MLIKAVIDRFEGDKAVLLFEDSEEKQVLWPKDKLPKPVSEGDILAIEVKVDDEATRIARKEATKLLQRVLEQNNK